MFLKLDFPLWNCPAAWLIVLGITLIFLKGSSFTDPKWSISKGVLLNIPLADNLSLPLAI